MYTPFLVRIGLLFGIFLIQSACAQDSATHISDTYLSELSTRMSRMEDRLNRKSGKTLYALKKEDEKLRRRLSRLDSNKAVQVFASAHEKYKALEQKLQTPGGASGYIPLLDSLKTSLRFLECYPNLLKGINNNEGQLSGAMSHIGKLETEVQKAEAIKTFLKERKQYLQQQLQDLGFDRELRRINKQAYYYVAQVREYKELLNDPSKIERKALEMLSKTKAFQDFMKKHSQLASLFRLPGDEPSAASLQGLQTRASVSALIQERIGSGGANAEALVRENIQAAQAQLSKLKNKAVALGQGSIGNAGDGELPDFKPNSQKTKPFLQRLEFGTNLQTQKGSHYFPITSDIGLSIAYKLNDKGILGIGASYKLGLGTGWNNISLTNQGMGLRSFIDYKLRGSLFISGGYEQNYRSSFRSFDQLKAYSAWQTSGLLGLSKKYKVSKEIKGEVKLLWDFLSYQQIPQTQAILFRIGYSLK